MRLGLARPAVACDGHQRLAVAERLAGRGCGVVGRRLAARDEDEAACRCGGRWQTASVVAGPGRPTSFFRPTDISAIIAAHVHIHLAHARAVPVPIARLRCRAQFQASPARAHQQPVGHPFANPAWRRPQLSELSAATGSRPSPFLDPADGDFGRCVIHHTRCMD